MLEIDANFPEKLGFLVFQPSRYKILWGGRGGSKSWGIARALLLLGISKKLRVLCTREIQKSIKDSVHKLLEDQIQLLGLGKKYEVLDNEIRGFRGTEFIFSGLAGHTIQSIKSFEGCTHVWIEEGQFLSKHSLGILIPTIRAERFTPASLKRFQDMAVQRPEHLRTKLLPMLQYKTDATVEALQSGEVTEDVKKVAVDPSEIWISFNPELDTDPVYERFIKNSHPDAIVQKLNWRDNPWFNKTMDDERLWDQENDTKNYNNRWEGDCKPAVEGAIYYEEIQKAIREKRIRNVPYDPMLKVHIIVDLGFNDACVVSAVQRQLSEIRIIRSLKKTGKDPTYFSALLKENKWNWGKVWLPFADGFSRGSSGQLSADKLWEAQGWDVAKKQDVAHMGLEEGIKVVRVKFGQVYIDETNDEGGLVESMKRYRRTIHQKTMEAGAPVHDEWCHGADNVRYVCTNVHSMTNDTDPLPMPTNVASYGVMDAGAGY